MSRAEKILRIREIMKELTDYWGFIDEALETDEGEDYIEQQYRWIYGLELEKARLEDELEREIY